MTTIIDNNLQLRRLITLYVEDKKTKLPPDLRDLPLNDWNVSRVTDMEQIFSDFRNFNENINDWDVSNVTNMKYMFEGCSRFNQPLNRWNVSNVDNMMGMFRGCTDFNQQLDRWNVSNVDNMMGMFYSCTHFNKPLNNWVISRETNIARMYENCGISQANKAVKQRRPPPPLPPPTPPPTNPNQGRAFEIHNYIEGLNMRKIHDFIVKFNERHHYVNEKTVERDPREGSSYFIHLFHFIHNSELFEPDEKDTNKEKLQRILEMTSGYSKFDDTLIYPTLEFVSKQNDAFIDQYIRILKDDCLNAYGRDQQSCIKGAYERIITALGDVAIVLTTKSEYRDNKTYNQLKLLFKKIDFQEVIQKWSELYLMDGPNHSEFEKLSLEDRKQHFIEYMRGIYRDAGILNETIENRIQMEASDYAIKDGVFERQYFGGKQKRKRNTKKKGTRRNTKKRK